MADRSNTSLLIVPLVQISRVCPREVGLPNFGLYKMTLLSVDDSSTSITYLGPWGIAGDSSEYKK